MEFKDVAIALIKGIVYKEDDLKLWEVLKKEEASLKDYFNKISLELIVEDSYAYLDEKEDVTIIQKRQLSFYASFLLVLLREKLAKSEGRVILFKEEIVEMIQLYIKEIKDEERLLKQIETSIKKVVELGFLKPLEEDAYLIRESLKSFVDAKWLSDFDKKLQEYIQYANQGE